MSIDCEVTAEEMIELQKKDDSLRKCWEEAEKGNSENREEVEVVAAAVVEDGHYLEEGEITEFVSERKETYEDVHVNPDRTVHRCLRFSNCGCKETRWF